MGQQSLLPFDDIRMLISQLPEANEELAEHTIGRLGLTSDHPPDRFSQLCIWLSRWSGRSPAIHKPLIALFCGTHGADLSADEHIPHEWLLQTVAEISAGSAPINQLCERFEVGLKLQDLALQIPVADITQEAAMDEKMCAGTIAFGMEAIAGGTDLLCLGAIEQGMNVSNLAMLACLFDKNTNDFGAVLQNELAVKALALHASDELSPLEILRRMGGRETAAVCGAIIAARSQHIPVILAGPTALAASAVLWNHDQSSVQHCLFAQPFNNSSLEEIRIKAAIPVVTSDRFSDFTLTQLPVSAGLVRAATLG
ncbi:MAG: nicotinate-nucleotide--dimethylbenzimidazole phosphoribosyltransferase [Pseudomonadota bacterium]